MGVKGSIYITGFFPFYGGVAQTRCQHTHMYTQISSISLSLGPVLPLTPLFISVYFLVTDSCQHYWSFQEISSSAQPS